MGEKPVTMISDEEAKEPTTLNEEEDMEAALVEPPDWLPDGWIMEVYRAEDGTIIRQYYTSPISNYTFTMKSEVLEYLFSGTDERMLESKERGAENTLQRQHEWLPKGWVMEVRAGGEKADKMYKFYVHSITGLRLLSKQDVLLYINEAKVSGCDTNEQCDTTSEDNILSKVDFRPSGLPEGWVKELVYRKTKEGLIRRDPYYTDPASSYTFRTLKSALSFLETGKVSERAFIQRTSVHDLYSFEISTDMHESLRNRLGINEKPYQEPTKSSRSRRAPKIDQEQNIDHCKFPTFVVIIINLVQFCAHLLDFFIVLFMF
ncbi:OSJNBb0058J09.3-like protein [Zea mays]|uniref:OSJNBb0058J09.3-like protein n=1 Tax=Zea mays TaxID=4577 RepID=A0A1D6KW59_MAIZE|nr:OSJNBb0058J09.3-like protein [Zea mays]